MYAVYENEYMYINTIKCLFTADTEPFWLVLSEFEAYRIPLSISSDSYSANSTLVPSQNRKIINRGTAGYAAWGACNAVVASRRPIYFKATIFPTR